MVVGESVNDLARKHKAVEVDNPILNKETDIKRVVFIKRNLENEWFIGEPISGFDYINYNKYSYKIESFGVNFSLSGFDFKKVKDTIVSLYNLPANGWTYLRENDPKYGEAEEYNYKCNSYTIRLAQSALGTSMQVAKR